MKMEIGTDIFKGNEVYKMEAESWLAKLTKTNKISTRTLIKYLRHINYTEEMIKEYCVKWDIES